MKTLSNQKQLNKNIINLSINLTIIKEKIYILIQIKSILFLLKKFRIMRMFIWIQIRIKIFNLTIIKKRESNFKIKIYKIKQTNNKE